MNIALSLNDNKLLKLLGFGTLMTAAFLSLSNPFPKRVYNTQSHIPTHAGSATELIAESAYVSHPLSVSLEGLVEDVPYKAFSSLGIQTECIKYDCEGSWHSKVVRGVDADKALEKQIKRAKAAGYKSIELVGADGIIARGPIDSQLLFSLAKENKVSRHDSYYEGFILGDKSEWLDRLEKIRFSNKTDYGLSSVGADYTYGQPKPLEEVVKTPINLADLTDKPVLLTAPDGYRVTIDVPQLSKANLVKVGDSWRIDGDLGESYMIRDIVEIAFAK